MKVVRFYIAIPEADIQDLRARLGSARWPDAVVGAGWDYGTNLEYLRALVDYWRDQFDWRRQEARLNEFAHYRADVQGTSLHFIHERGKGPAPFPLVVTHGWPSSFVEMVKILPLLTDPQAHGGDANDAFDVVVPSLPGHGFSGAPLQPGMSIFAVSQLWNELMTETLEYRRYGAQGGDWGAYLTSRLGFDYPENMLGIHLSFIPGGLSPYLGPGSAALSPAEQALQRQRARWNQEEGGYEHLQSTRPQTLAFGLNDSPVGLAAWMLEKFRAWSDCGGDVERVFSKDELLTQISLYWFTRTIASSVRLYYETQHAPWILGPGERVEVPTGVAMFPRELSCAPREWGERLYHIQQWTDMPRGGHFAAGEQPELLAEDLRRFFRPLRESLKP